MNDTTKRRKFLQQAALGTGALITIPAALSPGIWKKIYQKFKSEDDFVILFQGDSITDAHRERKYTDPNFSYGLGSGYVNYIATSMLGIEPNLNLKIYNRGISGNKVYQLADRWKQDCLDLKPHVLSILIGVNDYWHMYNGKYDGTVEKYENDYRGLLDRTLKELPKIELVICEPFAVKGGTAIKQDWFPAFDGYREVSKRIADEFDAIYVPFQAVFDEALESAPASYWCPDGVHPAPAGNYLMGQAWLNAYAEG